VWGDVPPAYVEIVTTGGSLKGKVHDALIELGWIKRVDGNVIVHDWEAHNSSLVRNWVRNAKWRQSREDSADKSAGVSHDKSTDPSTDPVAGPVHGTPDTTRHDTTRSTEERRMGGAAKISEPSASDVARSKAQFAALKAVVDDASGRLQDLSAEQRAEFRKNTAALKALQARQARGEF
jgi:hypothetical protein